MSPQQRGESDRGIAAAIGAELAYWRRRRGMTRAQLGELVHRSGNTIGRYERGNTMPDVAETMRLADALDVSAAVLVERAEQALRSDLDLRRETFAESVERDLRGTRPTEDSLAGEAPEASEESRDVG